MSRSRTQLLPPSPALAAYVQAIAVRRPGPVGPPLPAVQCFPANLQGALTVLHRGDWLDADTGRPMADLELAGPRLTPARRAYADDPAITTVLLRPGVLAWLFELPAEAWVNRRRTVIEVVGPATARALMDSLRGAASTAAEVWIIEQQLQDWVARATARRPWQAPPRAPADATRVGDWAGADAASARQLQRRVGAALGLPPKSLLRIERLHEGLRHMAAGEALADVALHCGFSHAAHMAHEFRALTGLSPAGVRRDLARHEGFPWRMGARPDATLDQAFTQST